MGVPKLEMDCFKNNLKALRKSLKLTQGEFCTQIGTIYTTYSSWERGKSLPNQDFMAHLIREYGYTWELWMYSENMMEEAEHVSSNRETDKKMEALAKENQELKNTIELLKRLEEALNVNIEDKNKLIKLLELQK